MQKKFVGNLIFLILINLLIKPLWIFGIDRVVQVRLGFDEYGVFYALLNVTFLFNMLLDLGIQSYNTREIAKEKNQLQVLFSNILVLKSLLSVVYIAITLIIGFVFQFSGKQWYWLLLLAFSQVLLYFVLYIRSNIAALQYFILDSILSVADKFLMLIGVGVILYLPAFQHLLSIQNFIYIQLIAYGFTFLVALISLKIIHGLPPLQADWGGVKKILKATFPYAIISFLMTIYFRLDSILINSWSGAKESGIYAAAYRMLDTANMFAFLFATLLLPMFSKLLAEKKSVAQLTGISSRILLSSSFILAIAFWFYRNELFEILYHQHQDYSANVMGVVMFSFPMVSLLYIYGTLLTAGGNIWWLNKVALLVVVINVSLNIILIPEYKSMGAAIAAITAHSVAALLNTTKAIRLHKLIFSKHDFFRIILFAVLSLLAFYFINVLQIEWKLKLFSSLAAAVIFVFALQILSVKKIIAMLNSFLIRNENSLK